MKPPLFLIVLFCTQLLFSQETPPNGFLPKWLTEEEKLRLHEIDHDREATDPPAQPSRNIAEFEPMSGALIRYPLGIPYSLIALMSEEVEVVTIVADHGLKQQAINNYQNHGVNLDNCSFIIAPTNSIWTRDYGPWYIFDSNNEFGIMDKDKKPQFPGWTNVSIFDPSNFKFPVMLSKKAQYAIYALVNLARKYTPLAKATTKIRETRLLS